MTGTAATVAVTPNEVHVANVLFEFARLADEGTLQQLGELLAPEMVWEMTGMVWRGRDEVVRGLGAMREQGHAGPDAGTRHVVTNQQVHVDADTATASSYFLLVAGGMPAEVRVVGAYRDRLRQVGGRWLMVHRQVGT